MPKQIKGAIKHGDVFAAVNKKGASGVPHVAALADIHELERVGEIMYLARADRDARTPQHAREQNDIVE